MPPLPSHPKNPVEKVSDETDFPKAMVANVSHANGAIRLQVEALPCAE